MATLQTIRFWIAIIMLVDAALGLWGSHRWQKMIPGLNIVRVALIEALAALTLLCIHFWIDPVV